MQYQASFRRDGQRKKTIIQKTGLKAIIQKISKVFEMEAPSCKPVYHNLPRFVRYAEILFDNFGILIGVIRPTIRSLLFLADILLRSNTFVFELRRIVSA